MYAIIGMARFGLQRWLEAGGAKVIGLTALIGTAVVIAAGVAVDPSVVTSAADVVGMGGWKSFVGCVACAVGAGYIVYGGPAAILVAMYTPGSLYVASGCIATCVAAVT